MENGKRRLGSPHIRGPLSTARIMQCVLLALLPSAVFGAVNFGTRALLHMAASIVACVLTEFTYEAFTDQRLTVGDLSAVVTGLLLALSLPVGAPLWMGPLGGIFAILIVKMLFGGIGRNILNPALTAWCFLRIFFDGPMTNYACDAYSGATPLTGLLAGETSDPFPMLLGTTGGCIGETSAIAILAGGLLLLGLGIINLRIPAACFGTFTFLLIFFGAHGADEVYLVTQLCGGGMMLAVWFMATDYVTSPVTGSGQILYGILLGAAAGIIRILAREGIPEGIAYAVLLGNLMTPLIDKLTVPRPFAVKPRKVK